MVLTIFYAGTWLSGSIRPYGLSYAHSPKGGALRPFAVSRLRLVGIYSAQRFITKLV